MKSLLDSLARRWLLRKGAKWRRETCETCAYFIKNLTFGNTVSRCRMTMLATAEHKTCPAWQRKEGA